jgi:hypothetical protein
MDNQNFGVVRAHALCLKQALDIPMWEKACCASVSQLGCVEIADGPAQGKPSWK